MNCRELSRRGLIMSTLALAGCQTTGTSMSSDRAVTNAYDGAYEIVVLRTWEYTDWTVESGHWDRYGGQLEELARLNTVAKSGMFSIRHLYDKSTGQNYKDFSGQFFSDGYLDLSMTVGYEVGQTDSKRIRAGGVIAEKLVAGEAVILDAGKFDDNHLARVRIKKM